MNTLRPQYEQRTFYGPLELDANMPQRGDRHMMVHPDDPSKLVRASGEGQYVDSVGMNERVAATQQTLEGLSRHGINHVHPKYIAETSESGEPYILTVVDRLKNAQSYTDFEQGGELSHEQAYEADQALSRMLLYAEEALRTNGYADLEVMRLDQFVFDSTQPVGKKAVLVDVEPIGGYKVDRSQDSMEQGYPSAPAVMVSKLTLDAIRVSEYMASQPESYGHAASAIEALPGDSSETNQLKATLLRALDTYAASVELQNLASGGFDDEDEWE